MLRRSSLRRSGRSTSLRPTEANSRNFYNVYSRRGNPRNSNNIRSLFWVSVSQKKKRISLHFAKFLTLMVAEMRQDFVQW